ncbi:MAG: glycosyltransferase family 2 protein [Chloroflexota bacterium]
MTDAIALPELPPEPCLPLVSVVVPTYRREALLVRTLETILSQRYPRLELLVVDQTERHEDATSAFLEGNRTRLRFVPSTPPAITRARSAGALAARGEIVLYVDDDVVCSPGLVEAHARAHQLRGVGVVAGRITEDEPKAVDDAWVGRLDRIGGVTRNYGSSVRQFVHHAQGPNMSFKREAILRAGLFEPRFDRTARFEELDACIRVARLEYSVLFEPTAHVHHFGGPGGQSYGVAFDGSYRSIVHNGLLFVWRNLRKRYWPEALLYRFRNAVYMSRREGTVLPLRIFFEETPRSIASYFRSTGSLPEGAPRWPVP